MSTEGRDRHERVRAVFERLLEAWRANESQLIGEYSSSMDEDYAKLAEAIGEWRHDFEGAWLL